MPSNTTSLPAGRQECFAFDKSENEGEFLGKRLINKYYISPITIYRD